MPRDAGPKPLRVPEGIPRLLRDLIHDRTGLFFEDTQMGFLIEKLEPTAQGRGFGSFLEYYYALKDNQHGEWDRAWEALSVQETYFWREMSQVNALVEVIVPDWFRKSILQFRIWSAACATGEEPYTIAMALAEAGFGSHPIEIVGSDASPSALEKARRGVYREKSFRALPPALRQKYFTPVAGGWKLAEEIMRRVQFKRVNLFEPGEIAPIARVNAIFCRNVFIYFSPHSIRQTVAMMASKMPAGGHLFVGASESLLRMTTDFELKEIANALVYSRI
ncbi:MAG TPA: protein-glutamate O-methyltransferase CheR [Methylomirabilota bacterium]|jgi:chemotaxis protein methyltransferase CheR|nr:protein-glutamate O-methyltransferase CheR [Methylomirabilota bacterium]